MKTKEQKQISRIIQILKKAVRPVGTVCGAVFDPLNVNCSISYCDNYYKCKHYSEIEKLFEELDKIKKKEKNNEENNRRSKQRRTGKITW